MKIQTKEPLVSIVIPTCNRARLLKKTIQSIYEQSYENWEALFIDDISADDTEKMLCDLSNRDSRIRYFRIPLDNNKGISKYLNYGLKNAKGKYISRIDDDDYWYDKDTLKIQVEFLESNPDYVLVGGGVIIVNDKYKMIFKYFKREKDEEIRNSALIANPFAHNTVMFRKEEILSIGGYSNIEFAEDWDLWLRVGKLGKMYNFRKYFTCYLTSGQNTSYKKLQKQSKFIIKLIKKYKNEYPNYYKGLFLSYIQYLYSFLPSPLTSRLHTFLIYFKRQNF